MDIPIIYLWLIAGVVFLMAEALGASGIGLLFAGFGALVVGTALQLGFIAGEATITQFILFFAATAAFAFLLWKPLQRFRLNHARGGYSNIIGETAYVGSGGLSRGKVGEVTWSGTIMQAELAHGVHTDRLDAGTAVTIVEITGAKLIVKPKA